MDIYDESNDLVKNNEDNDFNDNKLINLDSVAVNRDSRSDNELPTKKYIDDELDKNTVVRFNQTIQNYLKVSIGSDTYNLTKYNKIQITDTTISPNTGGYLLQNWLIKCNDKNNNSKIKNFINSTKKTSSTPDTEATSLAPIGDSFMYTETSSNNDRDNVFCSFERTDIIEISKITFYYIRFSGEGDHKAMGRFRIQLLLEDDTWSTRYHLLKNDRYIDSSTDCTLVSLNFFVENFAVKLIYDEIDTALCDMCFSNVTITHSVY